MTSAHRNGDAPACATMRGTGVSQRQEAGTSSGDRRTREYKVAAALAAHPTHAPRLPGTVPLQPSIQPTSAPVAAPTQDFAAATVLYLFVTTLPLALGNRAAAKSSSTRSLRGPSDACSAFRDFDAQRPLARSARRRVKRRSSNQRAHPGRRRTHCSRSPARNTTAGLTSRAREPFSYIGFPFLL